MRMIYADDTRLERTPDGRHWADGSVDYSFWRRYLEVFDEVRVVARVRAVAAPRPAARPIDGARVHVYGLPHYLGPWQFVARFAALQRALARCVDAADACVLRAPSAIAALLAHVLWRRGQSYAALVVGDPVEALARGGVRSVARPLAQRWHARALRRLVARAGTVAYVSERLRRLYPAGAGVATARFSDVHLPAEAFASAPRPAAALCGPLRVVFVGSLAQLYKGPDVLIDATARLAQAGRAVAVQMIGEGQERRGLEDFARRLGVRGAVRFEGQLPGGPAVRAALDAADVFVLPSRTEGLPRAMIEAMARGLPCVGTRAGGMPELLAPDDLAPPGDAAALAAVLDAVAASPRRREEMSARNLARAHEFEAARLWARRRAWYEAIRERTLGAGARGAPCWAPA